LENTFTNTQNKMPKNIFSKITTIIKDAKKGKMFILVDDKDRENEGDLIIPGSKCNSQSINFMAKHGRGLICLALTKQQIEKLKLPLMSRTNKSRMQTAFTISIEASKGITTGISAYDRAKTINVAINKNAKKLVKIFNPKFAVFIKSEIWPNYINELKKANIKF